MTTRVTEAETTYGPYHIETILKEVSDVVSSIDDVEDVMNQVVRLTSTLLGVKNCSIVIIEPDGVTLRIRASHGLPESVTEQWRGRVGEGISGYVAQTGKPLLIEDVETHPRFARKSKKRYSTKSLLSVPLIFQKRVIGVLNVNNRLDGRIFNRADELLLSVLANFIVIALEKAQMRHRLRETERIETELRVAREIQESILPRDLPELKRWRFAARNLPAREVAGDFYDAIALPDNRVCVVMGDVCGKGAPAAVYSGRMLGYFRAAAQVRRTPGEIISFVNDLLTPEWTERTFVTAVVGVFDDAGGAAFSSAGHQDPLRLRPPGIVESVSAGGGFPLGVMSGASFATSEVRTEANEAFLFYTDGITEATNADGEMFRRERLDEALKSDTRLPAEEILNRILSEVNDFVAGAPQSDDMTLLVAERI